MTRRPQVSIGMPVFNGEPFLVPAIESLLAQQSPGGGGFELLISDNASTDNTESICREFARTDDRVHYLRLEQNVGAARNYNLVFERARGSFFRWAAADDLCSPDHLRECVAALESHPDAALAYPKTQLIDANGQHKDSYDDGLDLRERTPAARLAHLLRELQLCNAVFGVMRREVLATTRLIGGYVASDQVLLVELALRGRFLELETPRFLRRLHDGGSQFAHETTEDLAAWFAPENGAAGGQRVPAPRTKLWTEILAAIARAPLGTTDRMRCYWAVHRQWMPHHWRAIGGELKHRVRRRRA